MQKLRVLRLVIAVAVLGGACTTSPTAPTPLTHIAVNDPVPDGYRFVCSTQPRMYCAALGTPCWYEIDTYTQETPCPQIPID